MTRDKQRKQTEDNNNNSSKNNFEPLDLPRANNGSSRIVATEHHRKEGSRSHSHSHSHSHSSSKHKHRKSFLWPSTRMPDKPEVSPGSPVEISRGQTYHQQRVTLQQQRANAQTNELVGAQLLLDTSDTQTKHNSPTPTTTTITPATPAATRSHHAHHKHRHGHSHAHATHHPTHQTPTGHQPATKRSPTNFYIQTATKSIKLSKVVYYKHQPVEGTPAEQQPVAAAGALPKSPKSPLPEVAGGSGGGGGGYEEQMTGEQEQPGELESLRDAQETTDDANILRRFKIIQLVGTGNYARVYKALSSTHKELAIKTINLSKTSENYRKKFLPKELTILRKINHPNIVKIHEIMQISDRVFIIMQFCSRGTIADLLHKNGPLNEPTARFLFAQVLDAVNYLHSIDIAHRDLKVENILLDSEFSPKLTDFSYSNFVTSLDKQSANNNSANADSSKQKQTTNPKTAALAAAAASRNYKIKLQDTFCGTLPYLSPEMIRQVPYDPRKTDIWSLGVCLFVMLNDRIPFPFNDIKSMIKKQLARDYKFRANVEFSAEVRDLVNLALEPEVARRAQCLELMLHPWLAGPRERPDG